VAAQAAEGAPLSLGKKRKSENAEKTTIHIKTTSHRPDASRLLEAGLRR